MSEVPSPPVPLERGRPQAIRDSLDDLQSLLAPLPLVAAASRPTIAHSAALRKTLQQAERVARAKATVLIEGESGTGKELLARLIHQCSPRASGPFVPVNCAALSESLVESELFGHEKGAFTGAWERRIGRFELAHGGTLLLDEVSETSLKLQAKLLRVLEEEEVQRVGGCSTLSLDVRVVATTNRNLQQECALGNFRHDLYYRLGVVRLSLPPLRSRREDIPPLVAHFIEQFQHEAAQPVAGVAPKTLEILQAYNWPGNVRQLRNVIHTACLLTGHSLIQPDELPPLDQPELPAASGPGQTLDELERQAIFHALRETGGNKRAAAERLGISSRTLLNKLNKYRSQQAA